MVRAGAGLYLGVSVFWLALSALFDGLATLFLPRQLGAILPEAGRATALGAITAVGLLAGMLVQPAAGALSDRLRPRFGRRGLLVVGVALLLPALGLLGLAGGVLGLLLAFVLVQCAASVAQAAYQGYVPDLVPSERRGLAAGLKGFMDVGGALVAFLLLGQLLESGGAGPALAALAAILVVALVAVLALVREGTNGAVAVPARAWSLPEVLGHRGFGRLVAGRFLFLLGTYAVGRFFLFFVADRLGLDPARAADEAGMLLAGLTLATVLAAPPAGWLADRLGRAPMMIAGAALSALGVLLLATAGGPGEILAYGVLMALGSAAFAGANWALAADLAPPTQAGRFMGVLNVGTAGAAAAAGLLGPLVDTAGFTALFAAAALAFAASGLADRGATPREEIHVGRPEAALR